MIQQSEKLLGRTYVTAQREPLPEPEPEQPQLILQESAVEDETFDKIDELWDVVKDL